MNDRCDCIEPVFTLTQSGSQWIVVAICMDCGHFSPPRFCRDGYPSEGEFKFLCAEAALLVEQGMTRV